MNLQICDISGSDNYSKIRPLAYCESELFVICFSVICHVSFGNVLSKWVTEVILSCPNCKILLLATKKDLREDESALRELKKEGREPISFEKGQAMAKKIKALNYMECSTNDPSTIASIFEYMAQFFCGE